MFFGRVVPNLRSCKCHGAHRHLGTAAWSGRNADGFADGEDARSGEGVSLKEHVAVAYERWPIASCISAPADGQVAASFA